MSAGEQRVALVTGSTSGIGLAIARRFAADGLIVALNGIEEAETGGRVAASVAPDAAYFAANLGQESGGGRLVAAVLARFGRLDVLVNNAGVQKVSSVVEFPEDDWTRVRALSLDAAFHTTKAALPGMLARGWGRVINIASAHGLVASPFKSAYVAAKHGLVGFTKTAALEVAEQGVTVNAICPGYVRTPLVESQVADQMQAHGMSREQVIREVILAAQPTKRFIETDEVAGLASFLCTEHARSITGATLAIDGGWTAR